MPYYRPAFGIAAAVFRIASCPSILFTASWPTAWTDVLLRAWGLMLPLRVLRGNTHRPNLCFKASPPQPLISMMPRLIELYICMYK
jgi:hypothetical protein